MNSFIIAIGLGMVVMVMMSGCVTTYQTEARYLDGYIELYCDGLYYNTDTPCGYIRNVWNHSIKVRALWNFKGADSVMWIKTLLPDENVSIYYYNNQAKYIVEARGFEEVIVPNYIEKVQK